MRVYFNILVADKCLGKMFTTTSVLCSFLLLEYWNNSIQFNNLDDVIATGKQNKTEKKGMKWRIFAQRVMNTFVTLCQTKRPLLLTKIKKIVKEFLCSLFSIEFTLAPGPHLIGFWLNSSFTFNFNLKITRSQGGLIHLNRVVVASNVFHGNFTVQNF